MWWAENAMMPSRRTNQQRIDVPVVIVGIRPTCLIDTDIDIVLLALEVETFEMQGDLSSPVDGWQDQASPRGADVAANQPVLAADGDPKDRRQDRPRRHTIDLDAQRTTSLKLCDWDARGVEQADVG